MSLRIISDPGPRPSPCACLLVPGRYEAITVFATIILVAIGTVFAKMTPYVTFGEILGWIGIATAILTPCACLVRLFLNRNQPPPEETLYLTPSQVTSL